MSVEELAAGAEWSRTVDFADGDHIEWAIDVRSGRDLREFFEDVPESRKCFPQLHFENTSK